MSSTVSKPINLTKQDFITSIFDYQTEKEWKYKGELPCIIDFWAEWCGPCRMIAPVLEELAEEYAGKINIYKIDTEAEQELAAAFGIRSIPSLLFVPMNGKPQMAAGAYPKEILQEIIEKELLSENAGEEEESLAKEWGNISSDELREWLDGSEESPILVDVRTPEEHEERNIPNSMLLPLSELEHRMNELSHLADKQIVVYCRSGGRSAHACQVLASQGYNVLNLEGGILSW